MKKPKIAIIGGTGFIGVNLANFLIKAGFNVVVVGRTIDKNKYNKGTVSFLRIDVNFTSKLYQQLKGCTVFIWLINNLVPSVHFDSLLDDFSHSVSPLVKFLEALGESKETNQFIYLSSGGTIYGNVSEKMPIDENSPTNPISQYGLTKLISEGYVKFLTKKNPQLSTFILRPSNVYGTNANLSKPQGIVAHSLKAALDKSVINIYGKGNIVRDYIHVDDLSRSIEACINVKQHDNSTTTLNIGSGIGHNILEVLQAIEQVTSLSIELQHLEERPYDCNYNILDISKASKFLEWAPKIELLEGLKLIWSSMIRDPKTPSVKKLLN